MQCYQYLASTLTIANALEKIPGAPKKLPPSVVADWMDENHIEADDAFLYDSRGDDVFIATPSEAHLYGPGFSSRAAGFRYAHAYAWLSRAYEKAGRADDAKKTLEEGLELFPADPNLLRVKSPR